MLVNRFLNIEYSVFVSVNTIANSIFKSYVLKHPDSHFDLFSFISCDTVVKTPLTIKA